MPVLALILSLIPALCAPSAAQAQGFAGLGQSAEGYALPTRGTALAFPDDHGAHPGYRIEWWYLTANLTDARGRPYGAQWTLFRAATAPGDDSPPTDGGEDWTTPQVWMGHAGLTTQSAHFSAERLSRGGIGLAGVRARPGFDAWIDDWRMQGAQDLSRLHVSAAGTAFSYGLSLTATGPLTLHGDRGYSVKSAAGQASYYYSQPFYTVTGTLDLPEGQVEVTGQAWLDREWSSQPLAGDQKGWDWVSLHLDGGDKLMAFRLRHADGTAFYSGTWVTPEGEATALAPGAIRLTPGRTARVAGRAIPVDWRLTVPERAVDVALTAVNDSAWMDTTPPYWEGPVTIRGSHSGVGYLEMTGYE